MALWTPDERPPEPFAGVVTLLGRILLGAIFVLSGLHKVMDPQGTQQYMAAMGMPWTPFFLVGAIILELAGGISLMLGAWTRIGTAALLVLMIPTTLIFHTHFADQNQFIHFLKNLSMMGGLVYVWTFGPGRLSLDAGLEQTNTAMPAWREQRSST